MRVVDQQISFKVNTSNTMYQVLNTAGDVVGSLPDLSSEQLLDLYRWMILGRVYSDRMVALQRQGRMGTFAPINGQEATSVGLAASLQADDWLVASYRESLSYMVKGVPLLTLLKQWGGYVADDYPREANCLPFQVVLGTQTLHAVGVAHGIKYKKKPDVVVTAIGDGATSEGDFNEALNFAGVYQAPVVFVVQNNGWAISTPRERQTASESIASRGPGFGLPGYVVDGNDILAVYQCVSDAIERARAGDGPTLIEAITYRLGAHTTADDPTKYRDNEAVEQWRHRDPLPRFRTFLMNQTLLTESEDQQLYDEAAAEVQAVVEAYEALPTPNPRQLFNIVYANPSPQLKAQEAHLMAELGLAI
ncbi:MAG: pyruvate dehydrogenase (acetyl-transferring) E1 component subunit alpha [Chloroflexota bacterium]